MEHHEVLIVGGGNAGISLGARLLRDGASDVAIVESQEVHRYRPLLNYVGAGEVDMSSLERPMGDVIPAGCTWIRDSVVSVDTGSSTLSTRDGRTLHWSTLVLCPGMQEDWDATTGLREAYDDGWAGSTFVPDSAPHVWKALRSLRSGSVVFTVPPEPAPCGATALKPLFMACDHWRRQGVLDDLEVRLVVPGPGVLGLSSADETLSSVAASYGVEVLPEARVVRLDSPSRAVTVDSPAGSRTLEDVAYAHVVPHYRAPRWIDESGLAIDAASGLVDIDPETLRHSRHQSIWALGDAAGVATRPSGGALRPQVEILAENIAAAARGDALRRYDGYTVMPITTSRRKLMLVEIDREGHAKPSVPFVVLTRPRRSTWLFDRYALPVIYFRRILRGKV
jgi:sulfide:quinone oxidoreductase